MSEAIRQDQAGTIRVTVEDRTVEVPAGTPAEEILRTSGLTFSPEPLGVFDGGVARSLDERINRSCVLRVIDFTQEEGRRIYERSLRYLFLLAVWRLYGNVRVRIEYSAGYGVYISMGIPVTQETVGRIEEEMRRLTREDLPVVRERWTKERTVEYFRGIGWQDKVRLLGYRPFGHFDIYTCGDFHEYFYGIMLPSTGRVRRYGLTLREPGIVLRMPSPKDPDRPAKAVDLPCLMEVFAESSRWNEMMECSNAADLNDMVRKGTLRSFIRVCDALQEKKIIAIADGIAQAGTRAVFIAGPSSSGKTTFMHRLEVQLQALGLRPLLLSLDDYYLPRERVPKDANGQPDLEHLEALDLELLDRQLSALVAGEEVELPRFDFSRNARGSGGRVRADREHPLLIEGIHALNPRISRSVSGERIKKIYISALTTLNLDDHCRIRTTDMRMLRRLVRDHRFRGTDCETTLKMWDSVRAGEDRWIFPFQEEADYMFNSSLTYEPAVLRGYAYPLLSAVPPESPRYTLARRQIKFLNYFLPADVESELPPTSILREFIGGCSFYD